MDGDLVLRISRTTGPRILRLKGDVVNPWGIKSKTRILLLAVPLPGKIPVPLVRACRWVISMSTSATGFDFYTKANLLAFL